MIFCASCAKFQGAGFCGVRITKFYDFKWFLPKVSKKQHFHETLQFLDLFGSWRPIPGGKKYPPTYFASFPTLKSPTRPKKKIFWIKSQFFFRVGGGSIAENSPTDGWPPYARWLKHHPKRMKLGRSYARTTKKEIKYLRAEVRLCHTTTNGITEQATRMLQ